MKKVFRKMKRYSAFFMAFVMIMSVLVVPQSASAAGKPKLNKAKLNMTVGSKYKLKVKNAPKGKTIKWSTSKKKVAAVSKKGIVTAKKAGSAKITAKVAGKKLICNVTVRDKATTEKTTEVPTTQAPAQTTPTVPTTVTPSTPTPSNPTNVTPTPSNPGNVTPTPNNPSQQPSSEQPSSEQPSSEDPSSEEPSSEEPSSEDISSVDLEGTEGKNEDEVAALKAIIEIQLARGAEISTDLDDDSEYVWDGEDGNLSLVEINWSNKKLKGKVSLTGLENLDTLNVSNNEIEELDISGCPELVKNKDNTRKFKYDKDDVTLVTEPKEEPGSEDIPSVDLEGTEGKNEDEVAALKAIIESQLAKGAEVSTDLNDDSEYVWDGEDGNLSLVEINWSNKKLKGNISFTGLENLDTLNVSNNEIEELDISGCPELVKNKDNTRKFKYDKDDVTLVTEPKEEPSSEEPSSEEPSSEEPSSEEPSSEKSVGKIYPFAVLLNDDGYYTGEDTIKEVVVGKTYELEMDLSDLGINADKPLAFVGVEFLGKEDATVNMTVSSAVIVDAKGKAVEDLEVDDESQDVTCSSDEEGESGYVGQYLIKVGSELTDLDGYKLLIKVKIDAYNVNAPKEEPSSEEPSSEEPSSEEPSSEEPSSEEPGNDLEDDFGYSATIYNAANHDEFTVTVGGNIDLNCIFGGPGFNGPNYDYGNVEWSASDNSIATVDSDGCVTGVSTGRTTITVRANYPDNSGRYCTATQEIIVEEAFLPPAIDEGTFSYVIGIDDDTDYYEEEVLGSWIEDNDNNQFTIKLYINRLDDNQDINLTKWELECIDGYSAEFVFKEGYDSSDLDYSDPLNCLENCFRLVLKNESNNKVIKTYSVLATEYVNNLY